jgi:hypothetical protein
MRLGFSLSPGGLLFPYHLGVLTALQRRGYVTDQTPLAGSSAGAIAVASHGAKVDPMDALSGCIRISEHCLKSEDGRARGKLMKLLEKELDEMLPPDAHHIVNSRTGMIGLAWKEIFPLPTKNVLATKFDNREDFIEAVVNSSMFPFFTSNMPFVVRKGTPINDLLSNNNHSNNRIDLPSTSTQELEVAYSDFLSNKSMREDDVTDLLSGRSAIIRKFNVPKITLPRLVVDGFFTVPRDRFGCPRFPEISGVEREILVSPFPHATVGLTASEPHNQIGPRVEEGEDSMSLLQKLFHAAVNPSSAAEHKQMFERGYRDAFRWSDEEDRRRAEVNDFFMSNLQTSPF